MNERIVYETSDGGVAVVIPSGELSVNKTAQKDVPTDTAYWIVDKSEIPADRSDRDAWELTDMPEPDGYGE